MAKIKTIRYGLTNRGNFEAWVNGQLAAFWSGDIKGQGEYQAGVEESLEVVADILGVKTKGLSKRQLRE
jgi:hypothetical protein